MNKEEKIEIPYLFEDMELTPEEAKAIDEAMLREPVKVITRELPSRKSKNEQTTEPK
jgi:hypothetical protein